MTEIHSHLCAFCNRTQDQVTHLVEGPGLYICDICIDGCIDTLAEKDAGWRERQVDRLLKFRHRRRAS
jgi:ATP-dependent Clp protease ATP-binding subunit ClpX